MSKKVIIVPIDRAAEQSLDFDEAKPNQLIELQLDEDDFLKLYSLGIFSLINNVGNVKIDDYENESIRNKIKIKKIIDNLIIKEGSVDVDLKNKILEIRKLFQEALTRGTGVYFYF